MTKERVHFGKWKSPKAEARFRAMEDAFWHEYWPDPPASFDVGTHLGPTRAYCWAGDGEPVVFLHGVGGTSIMWTGYVNELRGRTAYAIDTIGDVGRSEQRIPVEDAADLARWLGETLDALGIERAHLVGNSYGGFLALDLAAHAPERVRSVALLDPAGLVPVRMMRFLLWGLSLGLSSRLPRRLRRVAARRLRMPLVEDKRMMRMVLHGQLKHRTRMVPAGPLTDAELRSITAPVLLLLGEKSEIFPSTAALDRARALLTDVDAEIVPGAGHALPMSHTEYATARIAEFLERHDTSTAARTSD